MRTHTKLWVVLVVLLLIVGVVAVALGTGLIKTSPGLTNPLTDEIIYQIFTDNPFVQYRSFRVVGREECPLISGDTAQGISQRVLVSLSYEANTGAGFRNSSDMPIFLLRNGSWEKDPFRAHRCPNR